VVDPELVLNTMKVLIAAILARKENREVDIDEIVI
jgi:hypothetical protein